MAANFDIYGIPKALERYIRRIQEEPEICTENKEAILGFFRHCSATGLSQVRILFYAMRLLPMAKKLKKPFKQATKDDLLELVLWIENNPNFSPNTKSIYKTSLRVFYKFLEGNGQEYPEKIRWLKATVRNASRLLPEELLTVEEIRSLIAAALNLRDRTFISVLAESGCRIGEISGLKIKHITFDQYGAVLIVTGKTGMRRVRLLSSQHALAFWLENHPWKDNPEAPLWPRLTTQNRGKAMTYANLRLQMAKAAKKAGIRKRCNFHNFRHGRATELAKRGLNPAQMSAYLGWVQGTDMAAVYVHLSGADTDDAILKAYNLKKEQDAGASLVCSRCKAENPINARFCTSCGQPASIMHAVKLDEERSAWEAKMPTVMDWLADPKIRELIAKEIASRETPPPQ